MELRGGMSRARVFGALALFELRRRWYGHRFWIAVALIGLAALLLGTFARLRLLAFRDALELYDYVYLVVIALVFRFDIAHDIDLGFADFLAPNFVDLGTYIRARLVVGLLALVQFGLVAVVLTGLAPAFTTHYAAWATAHWLLLALLFAPFVALAELWLRTRLPVLAVGLMLAILVSAVMGAGHLDVVPALLGTGQLVQGSFTSLAGLAWRAALVGLAGLMASQFAISRHWAPA
ncbi:MAG: hypothetical protein P8Z36_01725 [Gemmatimonadota bacterium]